MKTERVELLMEEKGDLESVPVCWGVGWGRGLYLDNLELR